MLPICVEALYVLIWFVQPARYENIVLRQYKTHDTSLVLLSSRSSSPTVSLCCNFDLVMSFLLAILASACAFVIMVIGVPTNVTVDDQGFDPTTKYAVSYWPNSSYWSLGQTCTGCESQPDAKQAYEGTWHDTTYDPAYAGRNIPRNATFEFTGWSLVSSS